jgi:3-isopropylmalate/(R)-2-methylmalate dehydratase small subunit
MSTQIFEITGRIMPLAGNDIDTDQIIASRYLKWITFKGIEQHVFEDARVHARRNGSLHPFDDPRFLGATILLVNANFGCGSSREHAPQALKRYGFRAIVGESFGEIFAANCLSIGIPCAVASRAAIAEVQAYIEAQPEAVARLDLVDLRLQADGRSVEVSMRDGPRQRLIAGQWDSLSVLMEGTRASKAWFERRGSV